MASKTYAPTLYACAVSVRNVAKGIKYDLRSDGKLEQAIFDAGNEVINRIRRAGDFNDPTTTPFALPMLMPPMWDNDHENTGKIQLVGVSPASTAITEYWIVEFTSTTAFGITGRFSGEQGSGTTLVDFITTDGDLTIPSDAWVGEAKAGDRIFIPISKVYAELYRCVAWKAACLVMSGIYTEGTPNKSSGLDTICKRAEDMLTNMLENGLPNGRILDPTLPEKLEPDRIPYEINALGEDVSQEVYERDKYGEYFDN